ncbi:MAG: outer membrane protein assembly factor BamD, partial [Candidatus Acidiferrales bacterium]
MKGRTKRVLFFAALAVFLAATVGCHRHKHQALDPTESQEPDRILYEKSLEDIKNKRFEVARLTLQTLLNAYPDSDFLADAKLAIADSYYEESGGANLTHAEVEYK